MVGPSREQLLRVSMQENQLWHMIRQAAANDPALTDMLNEVKAYYLLKYGGTEYEKGINSYTQATGTKTRW